MQLKMFLAKIQIMVISYNPTWYIGYIGKCVYILDMQASLCVCVFYYILYKVFLVLTIEDKQYHYCDSCESSITTMGPFQRNAGWTNNKS